jgi:thioredoxin-related protein
MTEPISQNADRRGSASSTKWILLLVAAAVIAYGASLWPSPEAPAWPADLARAQSAAAASGRPILIQFNSDYCTYCARMRREVLLDPKVSELLALFELVQVDHDQADELADRYGIFGVPAFVVVDYQGRLVSKVEGYQATEPFNDFLRRAAAATQKRPP